LENLYETILQHEDLYRNLRGGIILWEFIADRARLYAILDTQDLNAAVDVFINARRNYQHSVKHTTTLTTLVDRYIVLEQETRDLGPA